VDDFGAPPFANALFDINVLNSAFVCNVLGIPLAACVLYPAFGLLLSPVVAAAP
jgi:hypothetical protein